jgi:hypothetical protein
MPRALEDPTRPTRLYIPGIRPSGGMATDQLLWAQVRE